MEEYDRLIESGAFDGRNARRIELIQGELREMTPIGIAHENAVDKLTVWSIDSAPRGKVRVRIQNSLALTVLESVPEPDVAWVVEREYAHARPNERDVLLIIEVAESSLAVDRGEKARLYATAGITDYWIVNLVDNCVEVYRQPSHGRYQRSQSYLSGEKITPLAFPDVELPVSLVF